MSVTEETLLELAKLGVTNHDARVVLVDAIRESGWWDSRIKFAMSNTIDEREEFLELLDWPGEPGERLSQIMVEALTTKHSQTELRPALLPLMFHLLRRNPGDPARDPSMCLDLLGIDGLFDE